MSLLNVKLTKNHWQPPIDDSSSSSQTLDLDSVDIRKFTRATCSQLETAQAVDKTLKRSFQHRIHDSESLNASGLNDSLFQVMQKVTTPEVSNHLATIAWESFRKFSVQPSVRSKVRAMSLPVESILSALRTISHSIDEERLSELLGSLGYSANEALCWAEYKNLCYKVFLGADSQEIHSMTTGKQTQSSHQSPPSPTRTVKVNAYEQLMRKGRASLSSTIDESIIPTEDSTVFQPSLPPRRKDILCQVLRNQYRENRKSAAGTGVCVYPYYHHRHGDSMDCTRSIYIVLLYNCLFIIIYQFDK